jgi:2-phosphoglycerate kinase
MRTMLTKAQHEELFLDESLSVDEYYQKFRGVQAFDAEMAKSIIVQEGVTNFIRTLHDYGHWQRYLIEGVSLTPSYMASLITEFPKITFRCMVLYQPNTEMLKKRIYSRGLWDDADKYPNYIKDYEIEWVTYANTWFKKEAELHRIPVVTVDA